MWVPAGRSKLEPGSIGFRTNHALLRDGEPCGWRSEHIQVKQEETGPDVKALHTVNKSRGAGPLEGAVGVWYAPRPGPAGSVSGPALSGLWSREDSPAPQTQPSTPCP